MFGVNPKALNQNMIWWPSKTFCNKIEQQSDAGGEFHLTIGPDVTKEQCVYDQTVNSCAVNVLLPYFRSCC